MRGNQERMFGGWGGWWWKGSLVCTVMIVNLSKDFIHKTNLTTHKVDTSLVFMACLPDSDSPHSEPGTIDEADNGTETHTSDEGQCIKSNLSFFPCLTSC